MKVWPLFCLSSKVIKPGPSELGISFPWIVSMPSRGVFFDNLWWMVCFCLIFYINHTGLKYHISLIVASWWRLLSNIALKFGIAVPMFVSQIFCVSYPMVVGIGMPLLGVTIFGQVIFLRQHTYISSAWMLQFS